MHVLGLQKSTDYCGAVEPHQDLSILLPAEPDATANRSLDTTAQNAQLDGSDIGT